MHEHAVPCQEKFGIPASWHLEERAEDGDLTLVDDRFKKFSFCVLSRMDLVDGRGNLRPDTFSKYMSDGHDISTLPGMLDECSLKKGTPEDKSFYFYQCYFKQHVFKI